MQFDPELYPWLSAGMFAWGLLDCFAGYRVFKVTITVMGAVSGAYFGHIAAVHFTLGVAGQIGVVVAGALLGGGLVFMLYLAAVFAAGLLFGLTLGLLLFTNFAPAVVLVAGCGLGLIGGFIALKLQKVLLILSTALVGSFRALLALMFFTQRIDWAYYLIQQPRQIPALIDSNAWLLPATITLAVVGALAQFGFGGKDAAKKDRSGEGEKSK